MRLLGLCALAIGLAALLLIGILDVVNELLSRGIFEASACPIEEPAGEEQSPPSSSTTPLP
jgi:hypothetical protein